MNPNFLVSLTLLLTVVVYVSGHASLMQPASRGSAFRVFPEGEFPHHEQDDSKFCNDRSINSTCGICGPLFNGDAASSVRHSTPDFNYDRIHYSFEKGGPIYTGKIVETYKKGQTIEALLRVI